MKTTTRIFGEIEIQEDKIIRFEHGIIGFPDLKQFTLIYDSEKEDKATISWLQSLDEPNLAFPVIDPLVVYPGYNPTVEDELLKPLGELTVDNLFILVTVTVPANIEDIAVNLKAPLAINTDTRKASQIIIDNDMPVKYKIYDIIKDTKEKAGE